MKDNLFEMLLTLFEKTLTQLKENHASMNLDEAGRESSGGTDVSMHASAYPSFIKAPHPDSIRVFTDNEQIKLTKASYQFLMRLASWGVLAPDLLEMILNQLIFSDSRFVSLQETKWTIRNTLANSLDAEQMAFLDLVLYQKEDGLPLH